MFLQHLARNPDTQQKMMDRIICKIDPSEAGKYSSYQGNETLDSFTKEVLRLYGPSPTLDRVVVKDLKIGRYTIVKGTRI